MSSPRARALWHRRVAIGHLGPAMYWLLGMRNLRRNPRRTGLTLGSLLIGVGALTFLSALNDGWLRETQENFVLTLMGHIQIHSAHARPDSGQPGYIHDPEAVERVLRQDPADLRWTTRLSVSGLAAVHSASAGVQVLAVDPAAEGRVTRLPDCLDRGRWLEDGAHREVLMGATLAENLGIDVGDRVVLMAQGAGEDMASQPFRLRGVLCSGSPQLDRTLAVIPLAEAQRWLGLGHAVTGLVIRLSRGRRAEPVAERLAARLPAGAYTVLPWRKLDPMVGQWLDFSRAYGVVLLLIVVALILTEVLNTMLMALHERSREIAVLEALGTRKSQLFWMLLAESLILVGAGATLGYLAGASAVGYYRHAGIDLSQFSHAFGIFYMSPVIHPVLTLGSATGILLTALLTALLAGLYPAWKSTRLRLEIVLRSR